jgi:hypothetical protein
VSSNTVTLLEGMAIGFGLGGTIFYGWGYREGVAWCVRRLGPFQELLNQLKAAREQKH